jgi:hypothetical protein
MDSPAWRLGCVLAALVPAVATAQSTWYVDVNAPCPGSGTAQSPYCSLQYAIDQPSTVGGDTLLVLPGIYTERIVISGKALTVASTAGASATTLANVVPPGQLCSSTVVVDGPSWMPVELRGFTIRCGLGEPQFSSDPRGFGGGIHTRSVALTVSNCELTGAFLPPDSVCIAGGGIYYEGPGFLGLRETTIRRCSALKGGGLAGIGPTVDLRRCVIEDNGIPGLPAGSEGGGCYLTSGHSFLVECLIQRNWTASAGGGLWGGGSVQVCHVRDNRVEQGSGGGASFSFIQQGCVLSGNQAEQYGGGAYQSTVFNSVVSDNRARLDGGGAWDSYLNGCTVERNFAAGSGGGAALGLISHCRVRENLAAQRGGGILGASAYFCVVFANRSSSGGSGLDSCLGPERCTIADNQGPLGSFGVLDCDLRDSIVWNNQPANAGGTTTANYCDVEGGWPGFGNIDSDPLFWHEQAGDLHLRYGSPCIDSANPGQTPDPDGSPADMGALWANPLFCGAAFAYCAPKTSSLGCAPRIASQGTCKAGQDGFFITASAVVSNKVGLLVWGESPASAPFAGGTLCVQPRERTQPQNSGGNPPPDDCSGSFSFHFSASYMALHALPTGISVFAQYWFRDPAHPDGTGAGLSDALQFMICAP